MTHASIWARLARFVRRGSVVACLFVLAHSEAARASDSRFSVRSTSGAAVMLSTDQLGRMHYDQPGVLGGAHVQYALRPWFELSAGVSGGAFLASSGNTGGLLAPLLGGLFRLPGRRLEPYFSAHAGPGFSGALTRPFFDLNVGVDIGLTRKFSLGPVLGYSQLVQFNGPGDSTDARYVWFGLSLRARPQKELPPQVAVRRQPVPAPTTIVVTEQKESTSEPPAADSSELMVLMERTLPSPKASLELLAPVLFRFDSAELEPIGVAMLHEVAGVLSARSDIALLEIQGYADLRGRADYNIELSQQRAQQVFAWLVAHGVAAERLTIAGRGEATPVEEGPEESAHEQNRRVVFRVLRLEQP